MLAATPWYLLPQFRPARLQDCVLWLESDSFSGGIWRNRAPSYTDRNHGIAHSGVGLFTWHPQFPPAPIFYGDDEYVEVPDSDSLDITDAITVEVWLKHFSRTDPNPRIVVKQPVNDAYLMWFENANDRIGFRMKRESDLAQNTAFASHIPDNIWHHFVGTYDGTDIKIYKDVIPKETVNFPGTIHTTDGNLVIGGKQDGNQQLYGIIPLVRIYKAALTPAEIIHNYTHHPLYYLQRGIDPYEVLSVATAAAAPSI